MTDLFNINACYDHQHAYLLSFISFQISGMAWMLISSLQPTSGLKQTNCWSDDFSFLSDSGSRSRAERLAGFCSYLRQKHMHLCREQRGFRRERRSQHALCKALVQAAREEPHQTAQLIQEQHQVTSTPSR